MDKALVEVYVPVLGRAYDIFIPLSSPMYEVLELVKRAVKELSDGSFAADEATAICHRENGTTLNINVSVYELGIRNGSKLMLI